MHARTQTGCCRQVRLVRKVQIFFGRLTRRWRCGTQPTRFPKIVRGPLPFTALPPASHHPQLDVAFESNDDEVVPEELDAPVDVPVTVSRDP